MEITLKTLDITMIIVFVIGLSMIISSSTRLSCKIENDPQNASSKQSLAIGIVMLIVSLGYLGFVVYKAQSMMSATTPTQVANAVIAVAQENKVPVVPAKIMTSANEAATEAAVKTVLKSNSSVPKPVVAELHAATEPMEVVNVAVQNNLKVNPVVLNNAAAKAAQGAAVEAVVNGSTTNVPNVVVKKMNNAK